jgi:hypothetical protein
MQPNFNKLYAIRLYPEKGFFRQLFQRIALKCIKQSLELVTGKIAALVYNDLVYPELSNVKVTSSPMITHLPRKAPVAEECSRIQRVPLGA